MNILSRNENRRMSPERILEMFLEVVQQHASRSYDFPIANLLDEYMRSRPIPNFPEVAMVISSAGTVYSRKVDYLESMLMSMHDRQNAPGRTERPNNPEPTDRTQGPDNPDQSIQIDRPVERKRLAPKRIKNVDHMRVTILLQPPKIIKKGTKTVEEVNLNSRDNMDSDKFKNYCQAVKSKIPVFYERINLLIAEKTDSYFDGPRPISNDDPDRQKNYNVFVGCISFKEKQMMSQREFLNRIQFDLKIDKEKSIEPIPPDYTLTAAYNTYYSKGLSESSMIAGDLNDDNETDWLESLRETSLFMDNLANKGTAGAGDDCDSAIVDDSVSQLNSIANESTCRLNSTEQNTLTESTVALDESAVINSTEISNLNETNGESTAIDSLAECSNITNDTVNQTTLNSTIHASDVMNSTTLEITDINGTTLTNGTVNGDSQLDPLNPNETTVSNEATQNDSVSDTEKTECKDNIRNIFRIDEQYLKVKEPFRLPLNILERQVNCKLNLFGIPFGRLRRQVNFALPKDFDSYKMNKRTRDIDECSTTTVRKFVKLNDGTATTSIDFILQAEHTCNHLNDPLIVPESNTNTAGIPLDGSSQPSDGTCVETGTTAECSVGEKLPNGDDLSTTKDASENPKLGDAATESQTSAITDIGIADCLTNVDGSTLQKLPTVDSQCDAISVFDSGIGTGTEGSLIEGSAITNRRKTLDLPPPPPSEEDIENENLAESDAQAASRVKEMTNLSEKVHRWHQRLKPILLHSEKRNDFNVKQTSQNIIDSFSKGKVPAPTESEIDRVVSFKEVMENRDKADTARYFFSMLQMANNNNVEIIVKHNDSSKLCPQDKIFMKLLDSNIREINPNIEMN